MKIFIGRFGHECNTMAKGRTEYTDVLRNGGWRRGKEVIDLFRGTPEFLGGVIDSGLAHGVELVPSVSMEVAAPPLSKDCLKAIEDQIMEDLDTCKDSIDGICFVLHGAGCVEGIEDLESYMLQRFRDVVGDDIPITVPLDLHGNISQDMVRLSNGLFGIKQYPHTDSAESGYLAMETLIETIKTGRKPQTACVRIPMLLPGVCGCTLEEPLVSINAHLAEYVKDHGLVDATLFHGFPYADIPISSMSVVTVGYDGVEEAAQELAAYVWGRKDEFKVKSMKPDPALDAANSWEIPGYVILHEASDNPGGGSPGDGTHLLQKMLERDLPNSVFCFIYDPEAAAELVSLGIGAETDITIGGKHDPRYGDPVTLQKAKILAVTDGHTISNSPMLLNTPRDFGTSVLLRVGNMDVIVGSVQRQTLDDRLLAALGVDVADYRIVAIKSVHHFKAFFWDKAAGIILVDTPGGHGADLKKLPYKNLIRPIYPLDDDVSL